MSRRLDEFTSGMSASHRADSEEAFEETDVMFADSAIAKMFTFEFVKGNPKKPLHDKFTVIINEEMAEKYFGDEDPIGHSLTFSGRNQFKVIGLLKISPRIPMSGSTCWCRMITCTTSKQDVLQRF